MIGKIKMGLDMAVDELEQWPRFYIWLGFLTAVILLAGYAILASLFLSQEILEFSIAIPWAGLIASYLFLVISGSGLCIVNALGAVFGLERYEAIAKRLVFLSLTSIVFGLTCILMHLGHPERLPIQNAISPNFRSAIAMMGALYSVYLVVVTIEFWLLIRPELQRRAEKAEGRLKLILNLAGLKRLETTRLAPILSNPLLLRLVGGLAFFTGVSALITLGSVFAHSEARSFWYGMYYPSYFLLSALFCGLALFLAVTIISYYVNRKEIQGDVRALLFEMARLLALFLAIGFLFTAYRMGVGLLDPARRGPVALLLFGSFAGSFWWFEIGLMTFVPIVLLIWSSLKESITGVLFGSLYVMIGAFVMRYQFVVAGQVYPNLKEGLPSYMPAFLEVFLICGAVAAFLFVYSIGERIFSFEDAPRHGPSDPFSQDS